MIMRYDDKTAEDSGPGCEGAAATNGLGYPHSSRRYPRLQLSSLTGPPNAISMQSAITSIDTTTKTTTCLR